jgi:hypothetical protein
MDMRGENAEYVGITKDGVAFLERPVNDSGCCRYMSALGQKRIAA